MIQATVADGGAVDDISHNRNFWALAIGSIGVVYGDIGTSPLYAFKEAVTAAQKNGLTGRPVVLGVLSLIFWALILIVTLKYVIVLLRADNKGEGGTFALMALAQSVARTSSGVILMLGVAGASFFYGDAVITPAISVLSAVEGLNLVNPAFEHVIMPLTLLVLFLLFMAQSHGTAKVASLFGPICALWFVVLAVGGAYQIWQNPSILVALNPWFGMRFVFENGLRSVAVLGLVFLAVTGAEALYADLGHFGRKPIQFAWMSFVLPALTLNYFGQGALILAHPEAIENPFYLLYPSDTLIPMVLLATAATVIASQAVITGAFSLSRQAIQLGLIPRLAVRHTSESMAGQIFLPRINWLLFIAVVIVTVSFGTSSKLAAAYGVAVTANMILASAITFFVIWKLWNWPMWQALGLMVPLILVEQLFFAANMTKVFEGGWLPLLFAGAIAMLIATWLKGSRCLVKETRHNEAEIGWLIRKLEAKPPYPINGTAVFLTGNSFAAPTALMHNIKHNRVLHERNILLTIKTADTPRVLNADRVKVEPIANGFVRITAKFGFMETPNIAKVLTLCRKSDLNIDMAGASFFLSRRSLIPSKKSEMPFLQDKLFIWMSKQAEDATTYFQIPMDRVVEIGTQVAV